ncbi:MAG TPA: glycoside hydrolase family 31 protein [Treponemataceae bacterium]|nr:glycoside hydrolase family 31 protein [Treponemataceae bacterium]
MAIRGPVREVLAYSNSVVFRFQEGSLEALSPAAGTLRLLWRSGSSCSSVSLPASADSLPVTAKGLRPSRAVVAEPVYAQVSESGSHTFEMRTFKLKVDPSTGSVSVYGSSGLLLESLAGMRDVWVSASGSSGGSAEEQKAGPAGSIGCGGGARMLRITFSLPAGESVYGLGEKTGWLDKRGRMYRMWNTDESLHRPDADPLYQSIPFMIRFDGASASGLFLDCTASSWFDVGFTNPEVLELTADSSFFDLYVFDGRASMPAAFAGAHAGIQPPAGSSAIPATGNPAATSQLGEPRAGGQTIAGGMPEHAGDSPASATSQPPAGSPPARGQQTPLAAVLSSYVALTGTMKLPPIWALGFQQCRWSYTPASRVLELAKTFREKHIPCDVIYLDIDYMEGYRVFTWSGEHFPDPAALIGRLHDMGFRVVTIVDPGVKRDSRYKVYLEGCKRDAFCKLPSGEIYHGRVWPGESAYPDFSSADTRSWWAENHRALFDPGVDGIWNDMNEPSDFSPDTGGDRSLGTVPGFVMTSGDGFPESFAEAHNAYGFDMARATQEAFAALKPNDRPFLVTRAGYAGIQRHSAVWTGDNHSWWEHLASGLPMLLNLGLSGVPFCGGDAGGFQGNASGELFARWMQAACFSPFFRAHSAAGTIDHECWSFSPETERIARDAIRLRYRLLPYLYSEMRRASLDGMPVLRPLIFDFPFDPNTRHLADQFMFGPSILVAPVVHQGKTERIVYLPDGLWYDWHTKEPVTGGTSFIARAPLDLIPMYVRAGAVIPVYAANLIEKVSSTAGLDFSAVEFEAYAGASGFFDFYEDDGLTADYQRGVYDLTRVSLSGNTSQNVSFTVLQGNWRGGRTTGKATIFGE